MSKERVLGSYLLRFTESRFEKQFFLHNLKTGEVIQFETWISAWAFLEQVIEGQDIPYHYGPHHCCGEPLD